MRGASSASSLRFEGLKEKIHPRNGSIRVWNNLTNAYEVLSMPIVNSDDYDDASKTYTNGFKSKNVVDSTALIWQGYWLDGALIPLVGLRRDELVHQGAIAPGLAGSNGAVNINSPLWVLPSAADPTKGLTYQDVSGNSKTYSLVARLPKSLRSNLPGNTDISVFANKSENFKPESRRDIRGRPLDSATGETEEYGFSISTLDDRLSLKVIHYETTVKGATMNGALSGFYLIGANEWWGGNAARAQRDANSWQAGNYGIATNGRVVTWQPDATNSAIIAGGSDGFIISGDPTSGYQQAVLDQTRASVDAAVNDWFAKLAPADLQAAWEFVSTANGVNNKDGNYDPSGMKLTGTTKSKGIEIEIAANPVKGLDLSFNASKTSAQRSDLAAGYSQWITQRWTDLQGPMGDIRIWGGGSGGETTRSKFRNETYAGYLLFNALEGTDAPELNKWRANLIGNYTFQSTALKGANVGGSYRWQDKKTIGFYSKVTVDPISNTPIDIADLSRPVKGKAEDAFDLWIGYQRQIHRHVNWRIQLNVRNVFAKDELIPNTIQPNGQVATYRIAEPRVFTLTNTFEF
jgi:hypothetical protein